MRPTRPGTHPAHDGGRLARCSDRRPHGRRVRTARPDRPDRAASSSPLLRRLARLAAVATGDELSDALAGRRRSPPRSRPRKPRSRSSPRSRPALARHRPTTAARRRQRRPHRRPGRVTKLTAEVNAVQATYDNLVVQLADLDAQLARDPGRGGGQGRPAGRSARRSWPSGSGRPTTDRTVAARDDPVGRLVHGRDQRRQQPARPRRPGPGPRRPDRRRPGDPVRAPPDGQPTRSDTEQLRAETAAQKAALDVEPDRLSRRRRRSSRCSRPRPSASSPSSGPPTRALAANDAAAARSCRPGGENASRSRARSTGSSAEQFAGGNIPSEYNGTLGWPINGHRHPGVRLHRVLPAEPPLGNCAHFHTGIDIADPMYTPIHAAGDGRVVYDGPLSDGAWVVIIAHSQDLVTLYGHVDNRHHPPVVRAGQSRAQGPDHRLRRDDRATRPGRTSTGRSSSTTSG